MDNKMMDNKYQIFLEEFAELCDKHEMLFEAEGEVRFLCKGDCNHAERRYSQLNYYHSSGTLTIRKDLYESSSYTSKRKQKEKEDYLKEMVTLKEESLKRAKKDLKESNE